MLAVHVHVHVHVPCIQKPHLLSNHYAIKYSANVYIILALSHIIILTDVVCFYSQFQQEYQTYYRHSFRVSDYLNREDAGLKDLLQFCDGIKVSKFIVYTMNEYPSIYIFVHNVYTNTIIVHVGLVLT